MAQRYILCKGLIKYNKDYACANYMFEVICFKETTTQCGGKLINIHARQLGKKKIGPFSFAIIDFFGAINLYKKFDEHQQQFIEDLVIYTYKVYKFFSSCENIWL